jgi:hypothetical protein
MTNILKFLAAVLILALLAQTALGQWLLAQAAAAIDQVAQGQQVIRYQPETAVSEPRPGWAQQADQPQQALQQPDPTSVYIRQEPASSLPAGAQGASGAFPGQQPTVFPPAASAGPPAAQPTPAAAIQPAAQPTPTAAIQLTAQPTPTAEYSPGFLAYCAHGQAAEEPVSNLCPSNAAEMLGSGR